MICPKDRTQMVNFTIEKTVGTSTDRNQISSTLVALPSGGIAEEDVYETWYVYECPKCKRRCKESYRCEVISP